MISAPASHVIAPKRLLDPLFATRALLELFALNKFFELVVQTAYFVTYLVLSACLARVELYAAVEAVMLSAAQAMQLRVFVEHKCELAIWSWAPRNIFRSGGVFESSLVEKSHFCLVKNSTENSWRHLALAPVLRTFERES